MLKRLGILLLATLVTACGGGSDASFDDGGARLLTAIEVTPAAAELGVGANLSYTATGIYSDGSEQDITASSNWASDNDSIASIDAAGTATAIAVGVARITATAEGVSGDANLSVIPATVAQLQILPPAAEIPVNTTQDYRAFAVYSDGTVENVTFNAEWELENDSGIIAAYDPGPSPAAREIDDFGTAIGVAAGEDVLVARFEGTESRSTVTVLEVPLASLSVTPRDIETPAGSLVAYTATGIYEDGSIGNLTKVVTRSSSDAAVATISNEDDRRGLAVALAEGSTTITASLDDLSDSTSLAVISAADELVRIDVLPAQATIGVDESLQYMAIGITESGESYDITDSAEWSSSSTVVAVIEENSGFATGLSPGQTLITASFESISGEASLDVEAGEVALEAITVEPIDTTLLALSVQQFTATGIYSDGSTRDLTTTALWSTGDAQVLVVSNLDDFGIGLGFAVAPGETSVTATVDRIAGSTPVTVIPRDDPLAQLVVNPPLAEIPFDGAQQYSAELLIQGQPAQDVSDLVSWASSDTDVATIDASGLAVAVQQGATSIAATLSYGSLNVQGTAALTVKPPDVVVEELVVEPPSSRVLVDNVTFYRATAIFSDGSRLNVTNISSWSTASSQVATINSSGMATGVSPGTTRVNVVFDDNGVPVSAEASITVLAAEAVGLVVTPPDASALVGTSVAYTATAEYADGTTQDVSGIAAWQSSNPAIAQVDSNGNATALAPGAVDITASLAAASGSLSDSGRLRVNAPEVTVEDLVVDPASADVLVGGKQAYTARAILSDGSSQDVTRDVSWNSGDTSVASVNGQGRATGLAEGSADITATLVVGGESFTDSGRLTVAPPEVTIEELIVDPPRATVLIDATAQFGARVVLSDGSSQDVTDRVTWNSSEDAVAHVDEVGLATGLAEGQSEISATLLFEGETYTDSGRLTVQPPAVTIDEIRVQPPAATVFIGGKQQYTAEALLSDGSLVDASAYASWQSADSGIATVNAQGRATGVAEGRTDIIATVTYQGETYSGAATLTVDPPAVTPEQLIVEPVQTTVLIDGSAAFTARLIFSDSSEQDVSDDATWSSSNTAVAAVDSTGLATGLAEGAADIVASLNIDGAVFSDSGRLRVESPAVGVDGLRVEPVSADILVETKQQFLAFAELSDGTDIEVTRDVSWNSSNESVAHVNAAGRATGIDEGVVDVTASLAYDGQTYSDSSELEVTAAAIGIDELIVEPAAAEVLVGGKQQYTARVVLSDGSQQDVTGDVSWTSADIDIASVNAQGRATGVSAGVAEITASLVFEGISYSDSGELTVTPPAVTVEELIVDPAGASVLIDGSAQFNARVVLSDGSSQDVTGDATWTVSDDGVAHVNDAGLATGLAEGRSEIIASLLVDGTSFSDSGRLTVEAPAVSIEEVRVLPATAEVFSGGKQQYTAEAVLSDGSIIDVTRDAAWRAGDDSIASVSSKGLATGLAEGSTPITATIEYQAETFPGEATLTVNPPLVTVEELLVEPVQSTVLVGSSQQFEARLLFTDGSQQDVSAQATWTSSDSTIASVDSAGMAAGQAPGAADIFAAVEVDGTLFSDSGRLRVEAPATVVTGVRVEPASAEVLVDTKQQFMAIAELSDGSEVDVTRDVAWNSSDQAVAHVNAQGRATGLAEGTAAIGATLNTGADIFTDDGQLTVLPLPVTVLELIVTPEDAEILIDSSVQYSAVAVLSDGSRPDVTGDVNWSSGNAGIAQVDSGGLATGIAEGGTNIRAVLEYGDGQSAQDTVPITVKAPEITVESLEVTPVTATVLVEEQQRYSATANLSDGSTQDVSRDVTWTSSDESIASVNKSGLATGIAEGSAQVNATLPTDDGPVSDSAELIVETPPRVLVSIDVLPATASLPVGGIQVYEAVGQFSDNTSEDLTDKVTWTTADSGIAGITAGGAARALAEGNTSILATFDDITGTAALQVTERELVYLQIVPPFVEGPAGDMGKLLALALYTDFSIENVTADASWSVADETVAVLGAPGENRIEFMLVAEGDTNITASFGGEDSTIPVAVSAAILESIAVSPANQSKALGLQASFTATGFYSDDSTAPLTAEAVWTSSEPSISAIVDQGLADGVGVGSATISASYDGITGTATHEVTPAELVSLSISPPEWTDPAGTTQPFTARAVYTDGTDTDVTQDVTWASDNPAIAEVSNDEPGKGIVALLTEGVTDITATLDGVTARSTVTVTAPVVVDIFVEPYDETYPDGGFLVLYRAIAVYSDGSQSNVTAEAAWSTLNRDVAVAGLVGEIFTVLPGRTDVIASYGGESGAAPINVVEAEVISLQIEPGRVEEPKGTELQLQAWAFYNNGKSEEVTGQAAWSTGDDSIATIVASGENAGRLTLEEEGETGAKALFEGVSQTIDVIVTEAVLVEIQIQPSNVSVPLGIDQQFEAIGIYSDGSSGPVFNETGEVGKSRLTEEVVWTSSAPQTVAIDGDGFAESLGVGTSSIGASYQGLSDSTTMTVTDAVITELEVSPFFNEGPVGTTAQLTVTAIYTDTGEGETGEDVTGLAEWTSSDGSIATVSRGGLLSYNGVSDPLPAVLTASLDGATGEALAVGTAAELTRIELTPDPFVTKVGISGIVAATGYYTDGTSETLNAEADWQIDDPSIATVSNGTGNGGTVTGVAPGGTIVRATAGEVSGSAVVEVEPAVLVEIQVTPAAVVGVEGTSRQLTATGFYDNDTSADITTEVTWLSEDPAVATASNGGANAGTLDLVAPGTTLVRATLDELSDQVAVAVTAAQLVEIEIAPVDEVIARGTTLQYVATLRYSNGSFEQVTETEGLLWRSSKRRVASINASNGLATGHRYLPFLGDTTTITASKDGLTSNEANLQVTAAEIIDLEIQPTGLTEPAGTSGQLQAIATYSDQSQRTVTRDASWESSDPGIAQVSNCGPLEGIFECSTGEVELLTPGVATITARFDGEEDSSEITVTDAVLVDIIVTPAFESLPVGLTQQYSAEGVFSDGQQTPIDGDVTWRSGNTNVATITPDGLADAIRSGTTQITASLDGVTGSATLEVTSAEIESIEIFPATAQTLFVGGKQQYTAQANFTDGESEDITRQVDWSVAPRDRGSFSAFFPGLFTANSVGIGTVHASYKPNLLDPALTDSVDVVVIEPTVVALEILTGDEPGDPVILTRGVPEDWTALATLDNGSTRDVTNDSTWTSSNEEIASVTLGRVDPLAVGPVTISASYAVGIASARATSDSVSDSVDATVTAPALVEIVVTPVNAETIVGGNVQFTAEAFYEDDPDTGRDVTTEAEWLSSDTNVASVLDGEAQALAVGMSGISATLEGQSDSGTLVVSERSASDTSVYPAEVPERSGEVITMPKEYSQRFIAVARYPDGTISEITRSADWESSNTRNFRVQNDPPADKGKVTVKDDQDPKSSEISATFDGVTNFELVAVDDSCEYLKKDYVLREMYPQPTEESILFGESLQMVVSGWYDKDNKGEETCLAPVPDIERNEDENDAFEPLRWFVDSGTDVLRIDEETGIATGIGCGTATIRVTKRKTNNDGDGFDNIEATTTLNVVCP